MTFQEYVRYREEEARRDPLSQSPFSAAGRGEILNSWVMHHRRLALIARTRGGYISPALAAFVHVYVPRTPTGISPLCGDEQPYGWEGPINEYAAECVIWHAFEILSDGEASDFFREHRPAVIFHYHENGVSHELEVRFEGGAWIVVQ